MSTLLEQASLIMIPSGYKEDVVYSVIPENGNGDLSFTRASNGTRVNSAGLVEVVAWNLAQYSEQPTNAIWTKQNSGTTFTLTDNFTTAPNGTTTACKYTWTAMDSAGKYFSFYQPITNSVGDLPVTFSVYMKGAVGGEKLYIYGNGYEGLQLVTLTTEWVRYEVTFDTSSGNILGFIGGEFGAGGMTTLAAGTAYVWGAQLNIGSTAKPYFPTTDRLNVPRLTYQNGGGGCPSLLLEKQSTNLATYSEDFSNASWTQTAITLTANATTSPDGTTNATSIIPTTANVGNHRVFETNSHSVATASYSIFVKPNGYYRVALRESGTTGAAIGFDLLNETIITTYSTGGCTTSGGKIENMGNGWYRVSGVFSFASATAQNLGLYVVSSSWTSGDPESVSWAGNGTSGVYLYGAQFEASSYPTSYIPTTSSSATRVADACSKTGITSLIGQTEGVLFVDFVFTAYDSQAKWIAFLGAQSSVLFIGLYATSSQGINAEIYNNTQQILINLSSFSVGQRYKLALAYKQNDFAFYVNGAQVGTDSSGTVPTVSELNFHYQNINDNLGNMIYNQMALFKTRLTNAELASLTTI